MGLIDITTRDTIDDIKNAPQTFSSWDNCMQKSYCKWPVIVGIVIGSIIVLSILFCCIRCLCCGLECCCGCFSCFNHCCPSPRRRDKRSKYADSPPYQPNPYHGYQPAPRAPPVYEAPKYAQFDTPSKKTNEDSLPAMPSWDGAVTRKVEDTSHDDMEMNNFNKEAGTGVGAAAVGTVGAVGAVGRPQLNHTGSHTGSASPSPYGNPSPTSPYGSGYAGERGANYSRPSIATNTSYASQQSTPYGSQHTGPTAQTRPYGGFRHPATADQFPSSAMAPTPNQYSATQSAYAYSSYSGTTGYDPASQYGQESGVTQSSPTSSRGDRPPSILQAGRKPVAGSWRNV